MQIPCMFQQSGWLFPTISFIVVGIFTYWASLYLTRAVQLMPGNNNFQRRIEISSISQFLFNKPLFMLTMFSLIASFMAANIAAIVISAQVMDSTITAMAGKTCALVLYDSQNTFSNSSGGVGGGGAFFQCTAPIIQGHVEDSPFGPTAYIISAGFLVVGKLAVF